MNKDTFRPHRRIEGRYAAAINRILKGLYKRTKGAGSPFQMPEVIRGFARSPTRTSKTGKRFIINTLTGEIVGGSPFIMKENEEAEKRFTKEALYDNMEQAVETLIGVTCYKPRGMVKIRIKHVSDHANIRMVERGIKASEIKGALREPIFTAPGNKPNTIKFYQNKLLVIAAGDGELKTCMWMTQGGKVIWAKRK